MHEMPGSHVRNVRPQVAPQGEQKNSDALPALQRDRPTDWRSDQAKEEILTLKDRR